MRVGTGMETEVDLIISHYWWRCFGAVWTVVAAQDANRNSWGAGSNSRNIGLWYDHCGYIDGEVYPLGRLAR